MAMTRAAIGVFDSGVGGLSVLRAIREALPDEDLVYVADSGFAPYGNRPGAFIQDRAEAILEFLIARGVKAVVVACNTVTAVAIQELRSRFTIAIVAIEPAVKPAAQITRTRVIGILATEQTLGSARFQRLVTTYGEGVEILLQPCPGLVEQVERGELDSSATAALIERYVAPLLARGADTLVLGCTHYPFLTPAIRAIAGSSVLIIDPAIAVARELERRLKAGGLLSVGGRPGTEQFWTSGVPDHVQPVMARLCGSRVDVRALPSDGRTVYPSAGVRADG